MDADERYMRQLGRKMKRGVPSTHTDGFVSRRIGTVVSKSGSALTVNFGSANSPLNVSGIPMLTACSGAKAGDEVVVETASHISVAIGILAR